MPTRSDGTPVALRIRYLWSGPVVWSGERENFGLQDRDEVLHSGTVLDGGETFHLDLQASPGAGGGVVLSGPFAHGSPTGRFLYLSWRDSNGPWARRLKLSLEVIDRDLLDAAADRGVPLCTLVDDRAPKVTRGGVNIGGTYPVVWGVSDG